MGEGRRQLERGPYGDRDTTGIANRSTATTYRPRPGRAPLRTVLAPMVMRDELSRRQPDNPYRN